MSTFAHSRKSSNESAKSSNSGASWQFIAEHVLSYPGTYEIPLRTMYTLNCVPRAQPMPNQQSRTTTPTSSNASTPTSPTYPQDHPAAFAQFTSALLREISQAPQQPSSLPPAFVTTFLNRCFPVELEMVDFPQSLAALDYLKDLETRRRKEIAASLRRLAIDQDKLGSPELFEELSQWNHSVADWVRSLENKERKVEALYTQLYVTLRRWILINEMCLEPFHKHNCHAMLNTLYPPIMNGSGFVQPTTKLTEKILQKQRDGFFRYIQTVERRGNKDCLDTLMGQGKLKGEANGWPSVKRTLGNYLTLANSMISECWDINNVPYNPTRPLLPPTEQSLDTMDVDKRNGRKVDSGISMGQEGHHSKNASTSSNKSTFSQVSQLSSRPATPMGKGGTTLERIAREFRKMRPKQKIEVNEIIPQRPYHDLDQENSRDSPAPAKTTMSRLRKMKSLGALSDLKQSNSSASSLRGVSGGRMPIYDPEEMKRQRDAFERRGAGP